MIKILILGGGFGGLKCALDLERKLKPELKSGKVELTLIDKNSYHLYIPALYEIASAYNIKKDPYSVELKRTICMPYLDIFAGKKINFIEAEIAEVNLAHKMIATTGNNIIEYDYLVFALGADMADYGIPGVIDYAYTFKNLDNALFMNQKLDELSEQFKTGTRTEPFSFLICGGGFTGIELAAELGCCTKVIKEKCKLRGRCSNITIFEGGPKILPAVNEKDREFIKKRLTNLGVILMENTPIEEIGSDYVKLKNGQKVQGDLVVWTAGIKPNSLLEGIQNLPMTKTGRIRVDQNLKADGTENIFAIGDNIEYVDPKTQKPVPSFAYVAIEQGKLAANNIHNLIRNKKMKSYKPFSGIWIIPIGGKFALAKLWQGIRVKGFLGWVIREMVDFRYLLTIFSLNRALDVFFNEVRIFSKND